MTIFAVVSLAQTYRTGGGVSYHNGMETTMFGDDRALSGDRDGCRSIIRFGTGQAIYEIKAGFCNA